jgi:hypothetical protein
MKQISCPHCGQFHLSGIRFCPKTGQPIPVAPTCPRCGTKVESDWLVCAACGRRLSAGKARASAPGIKLFGLLVGIMILMGAFAGGFWILTRTPSGISTPVPVGYGGELKGETVASPTISQPQPTLFETIDLARIATPTQLENISRTDLTKTPTTAPYQHLIDEKEYHHNIIHILSTIYTWRYKCQGEDLMKGESTEVKEEVVEPDKRRAIILDNRGNLREEIWVTDTVCTRQQGLSWECQDGVGVIGTRSPFYKVVEGQRYYGEVIDHGSKIESKYGKKCFLYHLTTKYSGEYYTVNNYLEACFDINTYYPIYLFSHYENIVNNEPAHLINSTCQDFEINPNLDISLPDGVLEPTATNQ